MIDEDFEKIASQEYLTGKQLTIVCISIIIIIQSIPLLIPQSPEMEWLLLGFTAAVSACAVVGAILVQFNADKMVVVQRKVFNTDFYKTIHLFTKIRDIIISEAESEGRNVEEELNDVLPKAYAFFRAYLDKESIEPLTLDELGIPPVSEKKITDEELFSKDV